MNEQDKNTDKAPPEELDGDKLDQAVGGADTLGVDLTARESSRKREESKK